MKSQSGADLSSRSAQQLTVAGMSFDERKTVAATKEDLEQNTADIPVVIQRQVLCDSEGTENGGCPTASVH